MEFSHNHCVSRPFLARYITMFRATDDLGALLQPIYAFFMRIVSNLLNRSLRNFHKHITPRLMDSASDINEQIHGWRTASERE